MKSPGTTFHKMQKSGWFVTGGLSGEPVRDWSQPCLESRLKASRWPTMRHTRFDEAQCNGRGRGVRSREREIVAGSYEQTRDRNR